jgi:hypothetical protein
MQSLPIFIVELQTAKRELLKNFELSDGSGSHRNATQGHRVVKNSRCLTLNPGAIADSTRCCMDERQGQVSLPAGQADGFYLK